MVINRLEYIYFFCRSYFKCVIKTCNARLATTGDVNGDLMLKYHHHDQHNHRADVSANIVSETMHEYREEIVKNPEGSAKQLFEDITGGPKKVSSLFLL